MTRRLAPAVHSPRRSAQAEAQALAGPALAFIAADEARLSRFFAETGLAPGDLRAAAASPTFANSLLEHLSGDEASFVAFAHEVGYDPARLDRLRQSLSSDDTP